MTRKKRRELFDYDPNSTREPTYISAADVADMYSCGIDKVYDLLRSNQIGSNRTSRGNRYRIKKSTAETALNYITVREIAEMYDVSIYKVYDALKSGELESSRRGHGKRYRIRRDVAAKAAGLFQC